jgi:tetratricopeptide (TPR) repeat protein
VQQIITTDCKFGSALRRWLACGLIIGAGTGVSGCVASSQSGSSTTTANAGGSTTSDAAAVQTLLKAGISEAAAKMLDEATTTFKDVLLISPKNVYALYNLGVIDQTENKTAGALSYYDEAIGADNTYTPAMYNKAIILEATNLNAALALYKQIVALDPNASTAYLHIAFVYAKQGQEADANEARAKAVALDASLSRYQLPAKCSQPNC